mgnify:CR=1 FL=1
MPADFQAVLNKTPRAKAFFATLDSRKRYAVLFRIQTAKKAETRAKRIKQFADMLSQHEKIYPCRPTLRCSGPLSAAAELKRG